MKTTLKFLLIVAAAVMGYLCVMSILAPIQFTEQKKKRDKAVIKRLIEIRTAEVAYFNTKGVYAHKFDSLEKFLKNTDLIFLVKKGSLTDEQLESGMTEQEAKEKGLIVRDTIKVNARDTLLGPSYKVDSIRFVPGTNVEFQLRATSIPTANGEMFMEVFQCNTPYSVYLKGLNRQEVINLTEKAKDLDRYPGLKVGDVFEINNNAGNWE